MQLGVFTCSFQVRWVDADLLGHMGASCYSEYATETRLRFLAEHGFPATMLQQMLFGPVILRDETRYRKEIRLGEAFEVNMLNAGLSPDGSQWAIVHEFTRADGQQAATLRAEGGWINLKVRKLFPPPEALYDALNGLRRSEDYQELPGFF